MNIITTISIITTTTTSCINNCSSNYTNYYNGTECVPKRNYLDLCNETFECQDYSPVNLVCRIGSYGFPQCVCNASYYWENCTGRCFMSKKVCCLSSFFPCVTTYNNLMLAFPSMYAIRQLYKQRM